MDTDKNPTLQPTPDPAPEPGPDPGSSPGADSSAPHQDRPGRAGQSMFAAVREWGITREADAPIGGVAGGLAKRLRTSSTFMRVLVVALVLLTGVGALAYAVAWALLPEERTGRIHLEDAVAGTFSPAWIGIVILVLMSTPEDTSSSLTLLILAVAALLLLGKLPGRDAAPRDLEGNGDITKDPPPAGRRTPWLSLVAFAVLVGLAVGVLGTANQVGYISTRGALLASALFGLALGATLLVVAALRGRSVVTLTAFTLTALLAALVAVLSPSLPTTLAGDRQLVGDMERTPSSLAQAQDGYALAVGSMTLDLRDLPRGTTDVEASVGVGQLTVIVPEGRDYAVDVTGVNAMSMPSESHDVRARPDSRDRGHSEERGAGRLNLNLRVGAGEVNVVER